MAGRKGEKHWRDAVRLAVNESVDGDAEGRKKLRVIADKLVELALDGDMNAIKEIGDRMDGKATTMHGTDPDNPFEVVGRIELVAKDSAG